MTFSVIKETQLARQLLYPTPGDQIFWEVVGEHLEEARFLIQHRQRALDSPLIRLNNLRPLEERLEAHLVGLDIGGSPVFERLLSQELDEMSEPAKTTLAALTLLRTGERASWYEVLDALLCSNRNEQFQALLDAFSLYDSPMFEVLLRDAFVRARSPREKASLLEVHQSRHIDPGSGIDDCLDESFLPLRRAAVVAAGRFGRHDLARRVERCLEDESPEIRDAAIEAGLHLGLSSAWSACHELAGETGDSSAKALVLLALSGSPRAHANIERQLDNGPMRQVALWAAGFVGSTKTAEYCLRYLDADDEQTSKLAAEAFAAVTGVDYLFDRSFHLGDESYFEDDEEDSTEPDGPSIEEVHNLYSGVIPDTTELLPRPEPYAIVEWWEANRNIFSAGERYLYGVPYGTETLLSALRGGPMRRRHCLALELALRTGGRRFILTHDITPFQLRQLEALSEIGDEDFINRF